MPSRLITPSQLSLFSISPVIGAWWGELQAVLLEQVQLAWLEPVPGKPTVLQLPPLRFTGMLKEAPRPPTEIELSPFLEK